GMHLAVDEEAGIGPAPVQIALEPEFIDQRDQVPVRRQHAVIEPIPHEPSEIGPRRKAADLGIRLEDRHSLAVSSHSIGERHPHESAAYDADTQGVTYRSSPNDTVRCHSMVLRRPSSSGTSAFTPSRRSQCDVSGTRRITSSYFLALNDSYGTNSILSSPGVPLTFLMRFASSRIVISSLLPILMTSPFASSRIIAA